MIVIIKKNLPHMGEVFWNLERDSLGSPVGELSPQVTEGLLCETKTL